jgi:2-polyprenyl-3-methyl-5-hydroxy-6-metoxy-1,4-benzoquinol methylase
MNNDKSIIQQQIEYYKARAAEYDDWHMRTGRYDRGEEHRQKWLHELNEIRTTLESLIPEGNILELACGTGLWTNSLVSNADKVVAVDSSEEVLEINRNLIRDDRVTYIKADLFNWKPSEKYDFIFFGFWLSHVPSTKFDDFWNMVKNALNEDGKVFFVDSLYTQDSTAKNHVIDQSGQVKRKLDDGREFEIVKVFYEPPALLQKLEERGWSGYVRSTENFFLFGCLNRSSSE